MSLRANLARLLASLRDDVARGRSCYRPRGRRLRPSSVTRCGGEYRNRWIDRDLASTALSRNPRAHIREPQTAGPVDDDEEKKEEERKDGFLADARETILVLARIAIVTSVISTLLVAYLITRLTHASSFPTILREGKIRPADVRAEYSCGSATTASAVKLVFCRST